MLHLGASEASWSSDTSVRQVQTVTGVFNLFFLSVNRVERGLNRGLMFWCWWVEIDWWCSWWSLDSPFSLLPPLLCPPNLKGLLSMPQSAACSLSAIITPLPPAVFKIMSCNSEWLLSSKQALIIAYQIISRKNSLKKKKTYQKTKQLKKLRCGDHVGETVVSLRLTMLFLKMSMTNLAHAFSHSLINFWQLFPGIMQENLG